MESPGAPAFLQAQHLPANAPETAGSPQAQPGLQAGSWTATSSLSSLLQQGQLSLQHSLAAGPVLMLTQVVVPALPAAKRMAQEVSLSSQFFGAIMPSHAGNIVCLQHATSWCLSSSRCLRLVMLLASAGPQLTGACSTALLGTSAGMSRVS